MGVWELVLGLGVIGAAIVIYYLPRLFLRQRKKQSLTELIETHPELGWVKWSFWILLVLWLVPAPIFLSKIVDGAYDKFVYIFGAWIAYMGVSIGLLSFVTGVCHVPFRYQFLYVYRSNARWIGGIQFVLGAVYILFAIVLSS